MRNFLLKATSFVFLLAALGLAATSPTSASVLDYQTAVKADTSAVALYDFDGSTITQRQENGTGNTSYDLLEVNETSEGYLSFSAGYDGTSYAMVPYVSAADANVGAAYQIANTLSLGSSVSYEAIVCPTSTSLPGYITGAYSGNNDRSYFALTGGNTFYTRIAGATAAPITSFSANSWYYLAITMDYDGTNTTLNSYYANLSEETPTLQQAQTDTVLAGNFTSASPLGIGVLHFLGASDPYQTFFNGKIDEISFYNEIKSLEDFNTNLALITSPSTTEYSYPLNGDFEAYADGTHFDAWSITQNLAVQTQSVISGTASAEILNQGATEVPHQMIQNVGSEWTFEMDFGAFDVISGGMGMNFAVMYSSTGQINIRMTEGGQLQAYSQGEGWQDLNLFANTTVDSGTYLDWDGETPVVNHIEVNGHYEAESPYYDLTLNGITIEGLQLFQHWAGEAPVTGDVPTRISIDSNVLGNPSWLADNIEIYSADSTPKVPGDANKDGKVDGSDVTILAGNWQAGVGDPNTETVTWEMGDFNGDGQVDGSDVTILAGNWQYGVEVAASAVPEPSTFALLLAALLSLIWTRFGSHRN